MLKWKTHPGIQTHLFAHLSGCLMVFLWIFVAGVDSLDEPMGACHCVPIEKTCWIQDSMPTRKKRGVAGKCTLPAGFVHNRSFAEVLLGSVWGLDHFWDLGVFFQVFMGF